jgi:hypothetical protein
MLNLVVRRETARLLKVKVKVKQSLYRPEKVLTVPEG